MDFQQFNIYIYNPAKTNRLRHQRVGVEEINIMSHQTHLNNYTHRKNKYRYLPSNNI